MFHLRLKNPSGKSSFVSGAKILLMVLLTVGSLAACQTHKASKMLYWGCVPTEEGLRYLKQAGVKCVVNFRTNGEVKKTKLAEELGLHFYHIQTGVFKTPEEKDLRKYLTILCDPKNQPAYVCCNIGIDRTSYYVAAYRVAMEGWTVEQASNEMIAHKVKQWWPTFVQYKDSLRTHEPFMRRLVRELGYEVGTHADICSTCPCSKEEMADMAKMAQELQCKKSDGEGLSSSTEKLLQSQPALLHAGSGFKGME